MIMGKLGMACSVETPETPDTDQIKMHYTILQ